ncbi:MAG: PAS domain-containing protein [Deltaproteobacteria bacterium]|nr:PAS domain-containing protein [Deltaproteobacteria bacterium]
MNSILSEEQKERRRKKRERLIIILTILVVLILTIWETKILRPDFPFSTSQRVVLFALINVNIILLLLLIFLVIRNLLKLVTERRRKILGSKIRTRLVMGFVTLSLVPTILLFFIAYEFMAIGLDYWFNIHIEKSLQDSLDVGRAYYQASQRGTRIYAQQISLNLSQSGFLRKNGGDDFLRNLQAKRQEYGLAWVGVFLPSLEQKILVSTSESYLKYFQDPPLSLIQKSFQPQGVFEVQSTPQGDFFIAGVPVGDGSSEGKSMATVVVATYFPGALLKKMETISTGLEGYRQMQMLKNPIKFIYLIILSIVSLLILFSATWFGFYLAKGMTVPIQRLAEGTLRIAQGDYNFSIDLEAKDEFGLLVNSFNKMTSDLRKGKEEIERTHQKLWKSNEELNQRKQYMEAVLANIGTGVISLDAEGRISTVNHSAREMLRIKTEKVLGRPYREVLLPEHKVLLHDLEANLDLIKMGTLKRTLQVPLQDKTLTLLLKITLLRDEEKRNLGMVLVFDDMTEIEKVQKVSAWREVARRLAHEIKNPLTPIKLSAQRLRKKYSYLLPEGKEKEIFDDCTQTIINQVDELIVLVNEFFAFARLPAVTLSINDLNALIQEVLILYQESRKNIDFSFLSDPEIPKFPLDREQIKRVMINLLDNAVAAIENQGSVQIRTGYDPSLKMVRIQVMDTGIGIAPRDRDRLFEPYFSTKKGGTGLGLTIVSSIISDHHGHIRVKNNEPHGTIFTIELPLEA